MSIKLIFTSAAAIAMVAGTPAVAAKGSQAAQAASSAASTAQAGGERKTCRYIDNTESRTKRERLCFTKEEWKKFDKAQSE